MKVNQGVFTAVLLLTFGQTNLGQFQCDETLYGNYELGRRTVNVPATIIAKVVKKLSDLAIPELIMPEIEVTLELNAAVKFDLSCSCKPCCREPEKQVASLVVSSTVRAFGGMVSFTGVSLKVCEGDKDSPPQESCTCPVTLEYEKGGRVPALGFGLSLGGLELRIERVTLSFSAKTSCGCTTDPRCFGNTPPTIVAVSPNQLDLNKGQSGTITVDAFDAQRLDFFPKAISGPGYFPVRLVTAWYGEDWKRGRAIFRVDFPAEGEPLRGLALVEAWDECGRKAERHIPIRLFYPPTISPISEGSGWRGRHFLQLFVVDDPDFNGCNYDRWEVVTVTAKAECGEVYPLEARVSCGCLAEECRTLEMTFTPPWVLQAELYDRGHGLVACGSSDRTPSCGGGGPAGGCREGRSPGATLEAR